MNAVIIAALLAIAAPAAADETPTPTPTAAPAAKSLAEAAKASQLDRQDDDSQPVVITDQNLQEYAAEGQLTTTGGPTTGRRPLKQEGAALAAGAPGETDETTQPWRAAYERQVELIRRLQSQIAVLDAAIPGLWTQFYSVDDPAYRDGVVKPKLDEALLRRQRLEQQLQEGMNRLPQILDEARRAGAPPSWSRGLPRVEDLQAEAAAAQTEEEESPEPVVLP